MALTIEENIVWLDIEMDDAPSVRCGQGVRGFQTEPGDIGGGPAALPLEPGTGGAIGLVAHNQENEAAAALGLVQRNYVGMLEGCHQACFVQQSIGSRRVQGQCGIENFDRYIAAEKSVFCSKHRSESTRPQQLTDLELSVDYRPQTGLEIA